MNEYFCCYWWDNACAAPFCPLLMLFNRATAVAVAAPIAKRPRQWSCGRRPYWKDRASVVAFILLPTLVECYECFYFIFCSTELHYTDIYDIFKIFHTPMWRPHDVFFFIAFFLSLKWYDLSLYSFQLMICYLKYGVCLKEPWIPIQINNYLSPT